MDSQEKTKPQQLIEKVQALLKELGLGTLSSIVYDNSDLAASGEFYEYVIVEGIKKKN